MTLVEIRQHKRKHWGKSAFSPGHFLRAQPLRRNTFERMLSLLKRQRSVLLQTPRWSGSKAFCREFCKQHSSAHYISIHCPAHMEIHEAWMYFLAEMRRAFQLPCEDRLQVIAERKGFRWKLKTLFTQFPNHEVFIFDRVERWPVTLIEDLQIAWKEYARVQPNCFLIVLAGAIQGGVFTNRLWLNDYTIGEAKQLLEYEIGRELNSEENHWLELSGGVPELVHALLWGCRNQNIQKAWIPIRREIHAVPDLISTRDQLLDRLFELQHGPLLFNKHTDQLLAQAGLIRIQLIDNHPRSELRSGIIAEELRLEEQ